MAARLAPVAVLRLRWLAPSGATFIGRRNDHNFRTVMETVEPVDHDLITGFKP